MPRQPIGRFVNKHLLAPLVSLKGEKVSTPEEVEAAIRRKVMEANTWFNVVNTSDLQGKKELLDRAEEVARKISQETSKRVFVFDQDLPQMKAKMGKWMLNNLPKSGNDFIRRGNQALPRFARLSHEDQERYLNQLNSFMNNRKMLRINQRLGYDYYISKLENWLKPRPGEPPSRVKDYLRKIIKSKYFYWFLLYKLVGLCVKVGLLAYFLLGLGKKGEAEAAVKEKGSD